MYMFFATARGNKLSRGNTCCQLFVTDKGFVYVVPMAKWLEVIHALKQLAKEIDAPDTIVCDMLGMQTSKEVRKFCNNINTLWRLLE